jgi:hypothetical protein
MIIPLMVQNRYPHKDLDSIFEVSFDINEKIIIELVEELVDILKMKKISMDINEIKNCILKHDELIQETKTWKRIQITIYNQHYRSGRQTRWSLFKSLMDVDKIKKSIDYKLQELTTTESKEDSKIIQELVASELETGVINDRIQ